MGGVGGCLWVLPSSSLGSPHSLPVLLLLDDGLKFHFYYYYFLKTGFGHNSFGANGFLSTHTPYLLNASHTFSTEALPLQSEGRTHSVNIFGTEPACNELQAPRKQGLGEMRIQFLFFMWAR